MRPRATSGNRSFAAWWLVSAFAAGLGCTSIVGLDGVNYTGGTGGTGAGGETGGDGGTGAATTTSMSTGGGGCTPEDDGKECTDDTCGPDGGTLHPPKAEGSPCAEAGGKLCSAGGNCVACLKDGDCAGDDAVCDTAAGTCGPKPPGCGDGDVTGAEECDDGDTASGDGCSGACTVEFGFECTGAPSTCKATCGDGLAAASEGCDDGDVDAGDGCSATCAVEPGFLCTGNQPSVCSPVCGDGVLTVGEQCEDGNAVAGDGCSAACQVEPFHQCVVGPPSVCTKHEVLCNDNDDNDDDGPDDNGDPDCQLPRYWEGCGAGEDRRVYKAVGLPLAIPDAAAAGVSSTVFVPEASLIDRAAIVFTATHPKTNNLTFVLTRPSGGTITAVSKVGGLNPNFIDTMLDTQCASPIGFAFGPYSGCFKPQMSFNVLGGTQAQGVWKLTVVDDTATGTGTLDEWALVLCTKR